MSCQIQARCRRSTALKSGKRCGARGFSLVELMVTLVIMSIFVGMAVPSFASFLQNSRGQAAQLDLLSSLSFARSEAVKRGVPVMLSATNPANAGNELGNGWTIWVDTNGNGVNDGNAEILRVHGAFSGDVKVSSAATQMSFQPSGYSGYRDASGNLSAASFTVCDSRHNATGGQVSVLPSGASSLNPSYVCP